MLARERESHARTFEYRRTILSIQAQLQGETISGLKRKQKLYKKQLKLKGLNLERYEL